MPEMSSYQAGTPSWADVTCQDLDGGIRFYRELFGWEIERGDAEYGHYSVALRNGKTVAAVMPPQPGSQAPPMWNTYFATDDADATARAARDAGADILVEPMDVGAQGRMLYAFDPTGAAFGAWQAGEHTGAQLVNEPGALVWNELHTPDRARANEFYAAVFGYSYEQIGEGEGFDYTLMKVGDRVVGGQFQAPPDVHPHWRVYFEVADADATAARARELGGSVLDEPRDSPYGRIAELADPGGARFSVIVSAAPGQP